VTSPALILSTTVTRKDREAVERIFVKAAPHAALVKGLSYFLEMEGEELVQNREKKEERGMLKWGLKVALETLSFGGGIV
jgi:nucleolar MIF4G domain-containing protein 1